MKNLTLSLIKTFSTVFTAQKRKFCINDFFSKCDQIRRQLRIWSHLLKKSLIENFIFFMQYLLTLKALEIKSITYHLRVSHLVRFTPDPKGGINRSHCYEKMKKRIGKYIDTYSKTLTLCMLETLNSSQKYLLEVTIQGFYTKQLFCTCCQIMCPSP